MATEYTINKFKDADAANLDATGPFAVVEDSVNTTDTSLSLVGKYYIGYGKDIAQNSVSLLENFASDTAPTNPIEGQLWWKPTEQQLYIRSNNAWLGIDSDSKVSTIMDTNTQPHTVVTSKVDGVYVSIISADTDDWVINTAEAVEQYFRDNGLIGLTADGIVSYSADEFIPSIEYTIAVLGTTDWNVAAGTSGVTYAVGTVFTAKVVGTGSGTATALPGGPATIKAGINLNTNYYKAMKFHGTATTALYADVAEMYSSDAEYEAGTVIMFNQAEGTHEVTQTSYSKSNRVIGVVTTNPALLMNSALSGTTVGVALLGRTPCKVTGEVAKGDRIISSDVPGHGQSENAVEDFSYQHVVGRAIESKTNPGEGIIEVVIGVK